MTNGMPVKEVDSCLILPMVKQSALTHRSYPNRLVKPRSIKFKTRQSVLPDRNQSPQIGLGGKPFPIESLAAKRQGLLSENCTRNVVQTLFLLIVRR